MDSLTQIALGASVGEAVLGRRVGYRAALAGAVCGTLPDLDSFIPHADAVATFTYHRSWSHSVFVLALLSPLLAWGVYKLQKPPTKTATAPSTASYRQWWLLVFLALVTHPLLDCFTVYGTQILWPLSDHPVSGSSVFIIDPAYTLPLAGGVLVALCLGRSRRARWWWNAAGLGLSSLYLAWSVAAKTMIEARIHEQLTAQALPWQQVLSTPAPFNTLLWRLVVMRDGGYYEAYYSVLDRPHRVDFKFIADDKPLLTPIRDHWPVQRLAWFTHGFYAARRDGDMLVMTDLRMGVEQAYIFNFAVAEFDGDTPAPVTATLVPANWSSATLAQLLKRTFTPVR